MQMAELNAASRCRQSYFCIHTTSVTSHQVELWRAKSRHAAVQHEAIQALWVFVQQGPKAKPLSLSSPPSFICNQSKYHMDASLVRSRWAVSNLCFGFTHYILRCGTKRLCVCIFMSDLIWMNVPSPTPSPTPPPLPSVLSPNKQEPLGTSLFVIKKPVSLWLVTILS